MLFWSLDPSKSGKSLGYALSLAQRKLGNAALDYFFFFFTLSPLFSSEIERMNDEANPLDIEGSWGQWAGAWGLVSSVTWKEQVKCHIFLGYKFYNCTSKAPVFDLFRILWGRQRMTQVLKVRVLMWFISSSVVSQEVNRVESWLFRGSEEVRAGGKIS